MRVARFEAIDFGASDADRLSIPRTFGSAKLAAITIATDSQADQAFVMDDQGVKPIGVIGVRAPYYPDPVSGNPINLAPVFLGIPEALLPTLLLNLSIPAYAGGAPRSVLADRLKYNRWNSQISVMAYYGGLPPWLPDARDPLKLQVASQVAAGALATIFRCITVGRDRTALAIPSPSGAGYATLVWELYGCTEEIANTNGIRRRDLLASGTDAFSELVVDSFDAIELDARDPGGPYDVDLMLTSWDR